MQRNSFVKMTKLPDVKGRIYYISSPVRQENLYAVYETTDRKYWTELAKCNQAEFVKSGTEGKCIEARELIIALPESFVDYEPKALLKLFTEHMKQNYGTECIAALHHNKRKTNYHIHLIFSERKLLEEPIEKIATRNMFYDETGKHVRTKKEILGEDGQIRAGCKVIAKGEVYERNLFTTKNARFKNEGFLDEVKRSYTDLINLYVKDDKQKLKVFDRNGVYLPMKKIGKNNPKAEQIIVDNEIRTKWNVTVDSALVAGISEAQIREVKRTQISQPASKSIKQNGRNPEMFSQLIKLAVSILEMLIRRIMDIVSNKEKEVQEAGASVPENAIKFETGNTAPKAKVEMPVPEQKQAPECPKQSMLASKYLRLQEVYEQLLKQTRAINSKKKDIEELKEELAEAKGIFRGKKRKTLQEKIDQTEVQLTNMEQRMPAIVRPYGYKNVNEFMAEYKASKAEYDTYQRAMKKYKKAVSGKPKSKPVEEPKKESVLSKLDRKKAEIKERDTYKQRTTIKPKDRGAR
ncbi:MAG: MobA/MobL family protein [Lachnospiraceae bacterium]|nr:MobA/MobL family protein [Lachnospiraceae bacterium]